MIPLILYPHFYTLLMLPYYYTFPTSLSPPPFYPLSALILYPYSTPFLYPLSTLIPHPYFPLITIPSFSILFTTPLCFLRCESSSSYSDRPLTTASVVCFLSSEGEIHSRQVNTPCQYILSTQPFNTLYQHTLSICHVNSSRQHTL